MGCAGTKDKQINLYPYFNSYSLDEYKLRELNEDDLSNGKIYNNSKFILRTDNYYNLLRQSYNIPANLDKNEYKGLF